MSSTRHLDGVRAYSRAADAFETVAWRSPTAARFDGRVADESAQPEPTLKELIADLPGWVTVVGGGLLAGFMGAMLGGALQV
ncbi:MAG: hypothetical protein ACOH1E_10160 [Brevundimonas sp.]